MVSLNVNKLMALKQYRSLGLIVAGVLVVLVTISLLVAHPKPTSDTSKTNLTGVVDAAFSEANAESALFSQQKELESLKEQMSQLKKSMQEGKQKSAVDSAKIESLVEDAIKSSLSVNAIQLADNSSHAVRSDAGNPWASSRQERTAKPHIHSVNFSYHHPRNASENILSHKRYVPSGTFVRAIVLGGADADASVNGQTKNNGVMLFKLLQPGTLPNGQHSRLQGCFVTASSYGDISSERAYVVLEKLSCAYRGEPIIDKAVTGWAFFGGKVGIKGQPLMRDNKIMQWAGISGAMSGIAAAAQYSQSIQSISALGSATTVPTGNIAPYAAYGGASKATEQLSQYYIKRADQYHPVIQVGSGNLVTIVFKDGFYLEPDEEVIARGQHANSTQATQRGLPTNEDGTANADFTVPPEVLSRIDKSYSTKVGE